MSDNAKKLSQARKFRGTVRGIITHLEVQISKLKAKPEITYSDSVRIQAHMERFISLDSDFKTQHFRIIELVDEDVETLKWERAILADHEDRMKEIMDRLTKLSNSKSSPTVTVPPMSLKAAAEPSRLSLQRLQCLESILRSVKKPSNL